MDLSKIVEKIGLVLIEKQQKLATAESCTGGLVAEIITSFPDASKFFERGFVTYSNLSKTEMLGVSEQTIQKYGAVSEETAKEMAEGAVLHSQAQISLSITGIAGPSGGTEQKPVGTVCFAWSLPNHDIITVTKKFSGDRSRVRLQAAKFSLEKLLNFITKNEL